ncbi:hypothetical protein Tco_1221621 [Tanacetum coccineum]
MSFKVQQIALNNALVAQENQRVIGKCNTRINPGMKPKESTYQVVLDALALTTCYHAFLITAEVPVIYMHPFWATVNKHKASYRFKIDNKKFSVNVEVFREIINICPRIPGAEPPKSKKPKTKSDSAISSEETPSKKKPTKSKKDVLSEVALSKAAQLKEATKRSQKEFHASHASGLGDGTDLGLGVPDEQHHKTTGTLMESDDGDNDDDDGNEVLVDNNDGKDDDEASNKRTESDKEEIHESHLEEVKTQLPQILPKVVSDFETPVIETNVTKSLEVAVLAKYSSQPKSTYEVAASLLEFELTKILIDKMEESKLHLKAEYKKELYDALVQSYNTDKDLFDTYGEIRDGKRRKSSKDAESSRDLRSKEKKSSSTPKDAFHSQHKSFGKSTHAEEPSHTVDDSGVHQNQEFDIGHTNDQPDIEAAPKHDYFKKPDQVARAEDPPTSFDELINTPIDFSVFVLNRLNITDLTQEILVGSAFNLLKGTCMSQIELEYHFEECGNMINMPTGALQRSGDYVNDSMDLASNRESLKLSTPEMIHCPLQIRIMKKCGSWSRG